MSKAQALTLGNPSYYYGSISVTQSTSTYCQTNMTAAAALGIGTAGVQRLDWVPPKDKIQKLLYLFDGTDKKPASTLKIIKNIGSHGKYDIGKRHVFSRENVVSSACCIVEHTTALKLMPQTRCTELFQDS